MADMTDKPIIFNQEMVKAILDDRKSCTRRVIKPIKEYTGIKHRKGFGFIEYPITDVDISKNKDTNIWMCFSGKMSGYIKSSYQVGQKLWVRETWCYAEGELYYRATDREITKEEYKEGMRWKSSTCMPKEYARIWLEVTNVRVERVQDINTTDIEKEGIKCIEYDNRITMEYKWIKLWNSINEKRGYSWESNPYVWVIEFKRLI